MTAVTRSDIIEAFGPLDDVVVSEIIELDATAADLAEAKAWIANDEVLMNSGRPLASGRVGQIVDVLATIKEEEEEPATGEG
jgi:hypothetical protein